MLDAHSCVQNFAQKLTIGKGDISSGSSPAISNDFDILVSSRGGLGENGINLKDDALEYFLCGDWGSDLEYMALGTHDF